ncbi:MAG: Maf family protein [Candidatus Helarchaeota archaeon]
MASESPRRRALLKKIGVEFERIRPKYQEIMHKGDTPEKYIWNNAVQKAKSVIDEIDEGIIIAADTIVVKDREILGKPKDKNDAQRMLKTLSGTSHYVYTALVVLEKFSNKMEVKIEKTKVEMRKLEEDEILRYINSGEPLDAAGGYKIQEQGAKFIKRIEGCYYNVVGLPIASLVEMLKKFNIKI